MLLLNAERERKLRIRNPWSAHWGFAEIALDQRRCRLKSGAEKLSGMGETKAANQYAGRAVGIAL